MKIFFNLFFFLIIYCDFTKAEIIEENGSIYTINNGIKSALLESKGNKYNGITTYEIDSISTDEKWAIIIESQTAIGARVQQSAFLYNFEHQIIPDAFKNIAIGSKIEKVSGVDKVLLFNSNEFIDLPKTIQSQKVEGIGSFITHCILKTQIKSKCGLVKIEASTYQLVVNDKTKSINSKVDDLILYPGLLKYGKESKDRNFYEIYYWDFLNDVDYRVDYNYKSKNVGFDFDIDKLESDSFGVIFRSITKKAARFKSSAHEGIGISIENIPHIRIYGLRKKSRSTLIALNKKTWESVYLNQISPEVYSVKFDGFDIRLEYSNHLVPSIYVNNKERKHLIMDPAYINF